jgi:hypothetical protein
MHLLFGCDAGALIVEPHRQKAANKQHSDARTDPLQTMLPADTGQCIGPIRRGTPIA